MGPEVVNTLLRQPEIVPYALALLIGQIMGGIQPIMGLEGNLPSQIKNIIKLFSVKGITSLLMPANKDNSEAAGEVASIFAGFKINILRANNKHVEKIGAPTREESKGPVDFFIKKLLHSLFEYSLVTDLPVDAAAIAIAVSLLGVATGLLDGPLTIAGLEIGGANPWWESIVLALLFTRRFNVVAPIMAGMARLLYD